MLHYVSLVLINLLHLHPRFLQCFNTVGLVIWPVKIVPKMTYNVLSAMLSLYTTTTFILFTISAVIIHHTFTFPF